MIWKNWRRILDETDPLLKKFLIEVEGENLLKRFAAAFPEYFLDEKSGREESVSMADFLRVLTALPQEGRIPASIVVAWTRGLTPGGLRTILLESGRSGADPKDMKIVDLRLHTQAENALRDKGIWTVADLLGKTADELLEARAFGRGMLKHVNERLSTYGFPQISS